MGDNAEVRNLLAEAAEWRLLGLLFEYPSETWREQLRALLGDVAGSLRALAEAGLAYCTEGMHFALFGPAGSVPVREVTYLGGVQLGYLMAELSSYYGAFGYSPATEEADDHLAVELGFVAYLKMKQAFAAVSEDAEAGGLAADAAAAFVREHLARMAGPVARGLEAFAPDYLIDAGRLIAERVGSPVRSEYSLGPGSLLEDDDLTCGASDIQDLVQLRPRKL
jgi:nitrate reductase assembly molybdenum cofactor insertion protein NarJ